MVMEKDGTKYYCGGHLPETYSIRKYRMFEITKVGR